jgi:hypothetical protein
VRGRESKREKDVEILTEATGNEDGESGRDESMYRSRVHGCPGDSVF